MVQTGSVVEYQREFEKLKAKVEMQESFAIDLFIGGLKEEVRHVVNNMNPASLGQAFRIARIQEDNFLVVMKKTKNANASSKTYLPKQEPMEPSNSDLSAPAQGNTPVGRRRTWKTLTDKEMEEKKAKGLCFYCDERYGPGHRCSKKLFRMDLCMGDCGESAKNDGAEEGEVAEEPLPKCKLHHLRLSRDLHPKIQLNTIAGEQLYDTINVTGITGGGQKILMLVDPGSTHNFLDTRVADQFGCEVEEVNELRISLADGQTVRSNKRCKCLTWRMEGELFQDEFLIIPVKDYDAILGVQWLQPLKQVIWDFEHKSLKFRCNGRQLSISATPTSSLSWMKKFLPLVHSSSRSLVPCPRKLSPPKEPFAEVIRELELKVKNKEKEDEEGTDPGKTLEKKAKTGKDSKVVLSGLLNFVNGLWSACGKKRIIIFTTNYADKHDHAMIRRGRMDKHIEMSYCCFEAFKVLSRNYLNDESQALFDEIRGVLEKTEITPADVAENLVLKSEDANVETCLKALIDALVAAKEKARLNAEEEARKRAEEEKDKKEEAVPKAEGQGKNEKKEYHDQNNRVLVYISYQAETRVHDTFNIVILKRKMNTATVNSNSLGLESKVLLGFEPRADLEQESQKAWGRSIQLPTGLSSGRPCWWKKLFINCLRTSNCVFQIFNLEGKVSKGDGLIRSVLRKGVEWVKRSVLEKVEEDDS